MNVLVVGSGGREHALCWKFSQSPYAEKVFAAPGNAGCPNTVNIQPTDFSALADFAEKENFLTVVGPEEPLAKGIVDYFAKRKLRILGPTSKAAEIESSKIFAKDFMTRYSIPTAGYKVFDGIAEAIGYARRNGWKVVVKADGLAGGKGVFVCETETATKEALQRIMVRKEFGEENGKRVILEDRVSGVEASFIVMTDGEKVIPLAHVKDYKRLEDNDTGPNTGGMGSCSPNGRINGPLQNAIIESIVKPTLKGLKEEGRKFSGFLYTGLMITDEGEPKVLEFNSRTGDPESQAILPRMKSDLLEAAYALVNGMFHVTEDFAWDERSSTCVIMASKGYPSESQKGKEIHGLEEAGKDKDVIVFHAGTTFRDGRIVTSGGRVLGVSALGKDVKEASVKAYSAVSKISWEGEYHRTDIGIS